jgi:hypothetical protein
MRNRITAGLIDNRGKIVDWTGFVLSELVRSDPAESGLLGAPDAVALGYQRHGNADDRPR